MFRRPKGMAEVRAAAASALGQIAHSKVVQVLAPFVGDRDLRVRKVARSNVNPESPPTAKDEGRTNTTTP